MIISIKKKCAKMVCEVFGHRIINIDTFAREARCKRCGAKINISYDMTTGDTIQEGELPQEKTIFLLPVPKMAIIGTQINGVISNGTVVFDVTHVKQNYHKRGSYTLLGDKEVNLGAVYGIGDIQER